MEQQALIVPTKEGEQVAAALLTRLHHRRDDPPTSRAAGARTARTLLACQRWALEVIRAFGRPGTLGEIADAMQHLAALRGKDRTWLYHELERRASELEGFELQVQRDWSKPCRGHAPGDVCRCQDVVRNRARVWEPA